MKEAMTEAIYSQADQAAIGKVSFVSESVSSRQNGGGVGAGTIRYR